MYPPADLDRSFFDPHLNSMFRLLRPQDAAAGAPPAPHAVELELVAIASLAPIPGFKRVGFVLTFRTRPAQPKPLPQQGTWPLEHPALGTLDIFLVPLGPDAKHPGTMLYEAVFN